MARPLQIHSDGPGARTALGRLTKALKSPAEPKSGDPSDQTLAFFERAAPPSPAGPQPRRDGGQVSHIPGKRET